MLIGIRPERLPSSPFLITYPPGHYYLPIADMSQILERENRIFKRNSKVCPGVDLREEAQLQLLDKLAKYYDQLPFSE